MTDHGFDDVVRFVATTGGTGGFVVAAAADTDHVRPQDAYAINGRKYRYYAKAGSQFERGYCQWVQAATRMDRVEINNTSNNDDSPVDFATPPIVDVFPAAPPLEQVPSFPTGTLMLFQQTSAPVGWTKQTAHNDKALRVVSGAASSGGSNSFSTVFAQTVVGGHTLTIAEIPSHAHVDDTLPNPPPTYPYGYTYFDSSGTGIDQAFGSPGAETSYVGGSGSHNHTITMSIQYVDIIICQKDAP